MKQFGAYWEVVHIPTGAVVNSGFDKGDDTPAGEEPVGGSGLYMLRHIPLFATEQAARAPQAETEEDVARAARQGESDYLQGNRLRNPYDKNVWPMAFEAWAKEVAACRRESRRKQKLLRTDF